MSQQQVVVEIEGDFIDSYIYSGTLFLVHADSKITTHNWEELLISAFRKPTLFDRTQTFLKDFKQVGNPKSLKTHQVTIPKDLLASAQVSTLQLKGWPTDINIYANRLFIASEDGVEEIPFNWKSKELNESHRFSIWKNYAYRVSANDEHRLAIAGGPRGVITAFPKKDRIETEDIITLLNIDSNDCEWIGTQLIANSTEGAYLATFQSLPKRPQEGKVPKEYWNVYNSVKRMAPQQKRVCHVEEDDTVYAWIAGMKLFAVSKNGKLSISQLSKDSTDSQELTQFDLGTNFGLNQAELTSTSISAARSAFFGTALEVEDSLFVVTEDATDVVSTRPVGWRVFPRAKNYLNHLHVIEKDKLLIRAYVPTDASIQSNKYGVSLSDVLDDQSDSHL